MKTDEKTILAVAVIATVLLLSKGSKLSTTLTSGGGSGSLTGISDTIEQIASRAASSVPDMAPIGFDLIVDTLKDQFSKATAKAKKEFDDALAAIKDKTEVNIPKITLPGKSIGWMLGEGLADNFFDLYKGSVSVGKGVGLEFNKWLTGLELINLLRSPYRSGMSLPQSPSVKPLSGMFNYPKLIIRHVPNNRGSTSSGETKSLIEGLKLNLNPSGLFDYTPSTEIDKKHTPHLRLRNEEQ